MNTNIYSLIDIFSKKDDYQLRYIYHTNLNDDAYSIELNLNQYQDLFNDWDGSALDRKELDPELNSFLARASYELPLKDKVEISFNLPEEKKDEKMEADSRATIKNNFRMNLFLIDRNLKESRKKIITYLLMGTAFLITTYLMPSEQDYSILTSLMLDGLFVGGWVFLWEALTIFFFKNSEMRDKRKRYLRYLNSNIIFKYSSGEE